MTEADVLRLLGEPNDQSKADRDVAWHSHAVRRLRGSPCMLLVSSRSGASRRKPMRPLSSSETAASSKYARRAAAGGGRRRLQARVALGWRASRGTGRSP